ncbi:MAG: hypothetical protein ACXWC9_06640 [Pseudobdellovibrionaceae bacterium]
MKSNSKQKLSLVLFVAIGVMVFQNCGRIGFNAQKGSFAGSVGLASEACEAYLKETYQKTYFPLLRTNCSACHANAHGSNDLETSFRGFMSKGVSTIDYKSMNPHGDNGINLTNQISSLKPEWDAGQEEYMTCLTAVDNGGSSGGKLKVLAKQIPDIELTLIPAQQGAWKTVEWDLESEVLPSQMGQFKAFLKIEARMSLNGSNVVGIDFRNPSVRLKNLEAGKNLQISGLNIYADKEMLADVTMYSSLSTIVADTGYVNLAPGSGIALAYMPDIDPGLPIGLEISNIQFTADDGKTPPTMPGTPTGVPVSYAQLTGMDPVYNVFRMRCFSCHSGERASGSTDLTNYPVAFGKATSIQGRVNNSASPMPPSGLLPAAERDIIGRWVRNGARQN